MRRVALGLGFFLAQVGCAGGEGNDGPSLAKVKPENGGANLAPHDWSKIPVPAENGPKLAPIAMTVPVRAEPGATAAARLKQMRSLAAQYSVVADYGNMKKENLRLLPTPIYRYASERQGVTDGALLAFVRGTDPEAFLMIEARKGGDGEWQHAFVRFVGHASLRAVRDDREVWQVDALPARVNTDPKQPYYGLRKYSDFPVVK